MDRITIMAGLVALAAALGSSAYAQPQAAADGHEEPNPGRVRTLEHRDGIAPPPAEQRATSAELSQMGAQLERQAAHDAQAAANAPKPVPPQ